MFRFFCVCISSVIVVGLVGCGRSGDKENQRITKELVEEERFTKEEAQRDAREHADEDRLAREDEKRRMKEEKAERKAERAEEQGRERRETDKQKRREKLCAELLSDLQVYIKPLRAQVHITPSANVRNLLGDDYTVELRGGVNPINLDDLGKAIAAKRWLDALNILQQTNTSEFPDEGSLDEIRSRFLSHEFILFVKTKAELSGTVVISLSEDKPELDASGPNPSQFVYVDGRPVRCGAIHTDVARVSKWKRHPEGSGWYTSWRPIDGEILIVPCLNDFLSETALLGKLQQYGPMLGGGAETGHNPDADKAPEMPVMTESSSSANRLRDAAGAKSPSETALVNKLEQKLRLGEVTLQQVSEALDKACLERFQARRKARNFHVGRNKERTQRSVLVSFGDYQNELQSGTA